LVRLYPQRVAIGHKRDYAAKDLRALGTVAQQAQKKKQKFKHRLLFYKRF
jgi:hypothetical protein